MATSWRLKYLATRSAPAVVFVTTLLALGAVALIRGEHQVTAVGYAAGQEIDVAPMGAGRVAQVWVRPGQQIRAGQRLAQLDTGALDRIIAEAEAELAHLKAQQSAVEGASRRQALLDARLFEGSVDALASDLEDAQKQAEAAEAAVAVLEPQLKRLRGLLDQQLTTRTEVEGAELELEEAKREAARRGAMVEILQTQLARGRQRLAAQQRLTAGEASALGEAAQVVAARLARLRAERDELTLTSPADGWVQGVERATGEVVAVGEPVLRLVGASVSEAVACVKEADAMALVVGQPARVWPYGLDGRHIDGRVSALGPMMADLPGRCPSTSFQPIRGREVSIRLDDPKGLVPGQTLHVRFGDAEHSAIVESQAAAATDRTLAPRPIDIPGALAARTRVEPSGLLWHPQLSRYLVVSDDTGRGGDDEHHPWLLTMTPGGRLDPEPLVIQGLAPVSDLEGIAADDAGHIWLLASQSASRKGNRQEARQRFVRATVTNDGRLLAQGSRALFAALEAAGPAAWRALGLPGDLSTLDIEGLTWHDGALYLGVKTPLRADGDALVWRMPRPQAFIDGGSLEEAGLTLWATIPLTASRDGQPTPGGVSELLFAPGGGLLVTTTPTTSDEGIAGGALWWVEAPSAGALSGRSVAQFDGRKPEGMSVTPDGGRVAIVFDAGGAPPDFVEVPWPSR